MVVWIILGAYMLFLLAPAIVVYAAVFGRRQGVPFPERSLTASPFAPFRAQILEEFAFFEALPRREVAIQAFDGAVLRGDYYDGGFPRTAICFHGYNATGLNCFSTLGRRLYLDGWNVLLVHERAHGPSGGRQSTLGIFEGRDVESWVDWAQADALVLAGVSMGCTALAYASGHITSPKVKALILDCGYTSPDAQLMAECRRRHLRCLLPIVRLCYRLRPGIDLRTPTWQALEHCRIPAFFLHGTADETVDISETEMNYRRCAAPKALYLVPDAPHAGAFLFGGGEAWDALRSFLSHPDGG